MKPKDNELLPYSDFAFNFKLRRYTKVVDMFGAGLPVAAARYDVIHELVKEEEGAWAAPDPVPGLGPGMGPGPGQKSKKRPATADASAAPGAPNGVLFSGPEELAKHLLELLRGWSDPAKGDGRTWHILPATSSNARKL